MSDDYEKVSKRYENLKLSVRIVDHLMENNLIRLRSEDEIEKKSLLEYIMEAVVNE